VRADVTTLGFAADPRTPLAAPPAPADPFEALVSLPAGDRLVLAWLPGVAGGARGLATARALAARRDLVVEVVGAPAHADEALLSAAVAVAAVLRSTDDDVPLATLVPLARATAAALECWRVVGSVAALGRPAPSLWHHALSWVPGTRFTVDLAGGAVRRGVDPRRRAPAPQPGPAWAAHTGAAGRAWGEELLERAGVRAQDVSACGHPVPRARPSAEVSVLAVPLAQLLADPAVTATEECRGCARPAPAGTCPFCGHHRTASTTTSEEHPA